MDDGGVRHAISIYLALLDIAVSAVPCASCCGVQNTFNSSYLMDMLLPNYHLLLEDDSSGYAELVLNDLTVQADHCYSTAWLTGVQLLQGNEQVRCACLQQAGGQA